CDLRYAHSVVAFFFQAEDGIRDRNVTGVQTCALPILPLPVTSVKETCRFYETVPTEISAVQAEERGEQILTDYLHTLVDPYGTRSEERRVGKECRRRWYPEREGKSGTERTERARGRSE